MRLLRPALAALYAIAACSTEPARRDVEPSPSAARDASTALAGGAARDAGLEGATPLPGAPPAPPDLRRSCDLPEDERKPPYGVACLTREEVDDLVARLKRAIQTRNHEAAVDLMAYPLTVSTELCAYEIGSKTALLGRFDAVIDARVQRTILSSRAPFFAKVDGVMMGSGEVWIERIDGRPAVTSVRGDQWEIRDLPCKGRALEDPPGFLWGTWRVVSAMGVEGGDPREVWTGTKAGKLTLDGSTRSGERAIMRGWRAQCELVQYGYHTGGPSRGESRRYGVKAELREPYVMMLACHDRGKRHVERIEVLSDTLLSYYTGGVVVFLRRERGDSRAPPRVVARDEPCGSLDITCGPGLFCAATVGVEGRLQEVCRSLAR